VAYDPLDIEAFRIANDVSLPPEQRQQMIDDLYAQAPAGMPEVPSMGDVGATAGPPASIAAPQQPMIQPGAQMQVMTPAGVNAPAPGPPPVGDAQAVQQQLGIAPQPAAPAAPAAPPAIRFAGQPGAPQAGGGFQLPPLPQARTVKVGTNKFQPSARNIQTQFAPKLSEETERALHEAEIAEGVATIKAAEAGVTAGEQVAREQTNVDAFKAGLAEEQARRDRDRAAEVQRYEQRYREFADEAQMQSRITPPKWSDKMSNRFAIALGALGSALTGQPNQVWEMVKSEIDNEILAQRENAQLLGRRAEQERTFYQMARERFGDERLAELAALEQAYAQADQELARFADSARTPERQAALEGLRAQVQKSIVEASAQREMAQQDQIAIAEAQKFDPVRYQTAGGDPLKQLKYTLDLVNTSKALGKALAPQQAVDPSHKLYIPGLGYARTHQDAQSMRELQANYEETMRGFDEAEKYIKDPSAAAGAFGRGTSEYHSASALTQQLAMGTAKSYGGVVTSSDIENAKKEVPDLTAIGGGQKEKLKVAREKFIRRYESQIKSKVTAEPPENVGPEPQPRAEGQ
jgi:hypothetical protein